MVFLILFDSEKSVRSGGGGAEREREREREIVLYFDFEGIVVYYFVCDK